jgi:hypothetical protein
MNRSRLEKIASELEDNTDFSEGDLELVIRCRRCKSLFALNPESVAMALITKESVWGYIKWIQLSKCTKCNPMENADGTKKI